MIKQFTLASHDGTEVNKTDFIFDMTELTLQCKRH